ncbi:phosphonate metabolism protein/1,5-bisphosphokinase (PRPP-forming) PhnN [Brucella sp. H1_1004]|uniref:phosphonate metabolism protein/1,5-bisphosphokinase (PRPP-forming) PhnN n=1 Tax=Brucella sp. H1_1004 TaxID=3110109 RepID=UPI0039B62C85
MRDVCRSSAPKGCFVAVVGPSGAGKDTIMDAARAALAADPKFHFVRRTITRLQVPGTEYHDSLSEEAFSKAADDGAFALHWQAHGLSYGLPKSLNHEIAKGAVVIANVSRSVLGEIRSLYAVRCIVVISAKPEVLAERLTARGRESREEIIKRLSREVYFDDGADDVLIIDNSGDVTIAKDIFIRNLKNISKSII